MIKIHIGVGISTKKGSVRVLLNDAFLFKTSESFCIEKNSDQSSNLFKLINDSRDEVDVTSLEFYGIPAPRVILPQTIQPQSSFEYKFSLPADWLRVIT